MGDWHVELSRMFLDFSADQIGSLHRLAGERLMESPRLRDADSLYCRCANSVGQNRI